MKIRLSDQRVRPSALYRIIAVGYALGVLAIFLPFMVLFVVTGLFGTPASNGNVSPFAIVLLLPFIAIVQGLMIAGLVTLGLWIYSKYRNIEVER